MVFTGMLCRFAICYDSLLLKRACTRNSRKLMAETWLFAHKSSWKLCYGMTGETEIVNAQGSDKDWYLTSWNKYTDTKSCHLWSLWKFREFSRKVCILIWLHRCTENQIFLKNSLFSNVDIHMFLYWFVECLQLNRMCITSIWFYRKLVMKGK